MNKRKLNKIKRLIESMRSRIANIRSEELISLAHQLGRERSQRGKEPTYESTLLPKRAPISIPNHPGSLNKFTAGSILDDLEKDVFDIEESLEEEGEKKNA